MQELGFIPMTRRIGYFLQARRQRCMVKDGMDFPRDFPRCSTGMDVVARRLNEESVFRNEKHAVVGRIGKRHGYDMMLRAEVAVDTWRAF